MNDRQKEMLQNAIYYIGQLEKIKDDPELSPTMKKMIAAYIKKYLKQCKDVMEVEK